MKAILKVMVIFGRPSYCTIVPASVLDPSQPMTPASHPQNFATNAEKGVKLILKSDFTSQDTVRERGLGGGASLSDYSETCSCWLTASRVPCQSAHIVSWLSLGLGWAIDGANIAALEHGPLWVLILDGYWSAL